MVNPAPHPAPLPAAAPRLEEVSAGDVRDCGAAFGFCLARIAGLEDRRPVALVLSPQWIREWGRPYIPGTPQGLRLMLVRPREEKHILWAMEEVLKSGAVAGALGAVEQADLVATRRLDFAARASGAMGILLRSRPSDELSAAHLRWRIESLPSSAHPLDSRTPGAARLRARLVRRRDGPPGSWDLEHDHETHRLRLAARLADHGLVAQVRTVAAA